MTIYKSSNIATVILSDGEEIETTMFHPFYVQNDEKTNSGKWTSASNLVSGDKLLMEDEESVYVDEVRIEKLAQSIKVYNLEIEELHTYFVGDGILVHNDCGIGGNGSINLPEYDGKTTHGVLVLDDGIQISFISGNGDTRYINYANNGHVKQKASLYMRESDISSATLYHNNTNGTCGFCNNMTPTFLPEGASLTVIPSSNAIPNNSRAVAVLKTYIGNEKILKVSNKYKGAFL